MISFKNLAFLSVLLTGCSAFTPFTAFKTSTRTSPSTSLNAYVPDGLTPEQWKKFKNDEAGRLMGKDLGRLGPRGFKSRSMEAWQKAYEKGQASHAFAPLNYKEKLQKRIIKAEDIPYMVRGGSWDNADIFGARKLSWLKEDREYVNGGYKKEQSVSILGSGPGLDWTGSRPRTENPKKIVPGFS